jgi:putative flippase GtrA
MIASLKQRLLASPRLRAWSNVIRFLAVGGLNTLFGFLVYSLLIWLGLRLEAALLFSWVIGLAFNFVTYGKLAFGSKLTRHNLPRFTGVYALSYFLNLFLDQRLIAMGLSAYAAQFVVLPFMAATMFFALRYFVYR